MSIANSTTLNQIPTIIRKVSVAMATYNGEKYIEEQLQSLLNQHYPSVEIIISDDNSTDNTFPILKKWQELYPSKIFIFQNQENLGFNKNFEKVIGACTGDYIAISDQDDIWLPDKISKLIEQLKQGGNILAHCQSIGFSEQEGTFKKGSLERQHTFNGTDIRELVFYNRVEGHNMIFKRELLEHILPFPKGIYYDWWIAALAANYGKVVSVDEYLVKHRLHNENYYYATRRDNKAELDEKLRFIKALHKAAIGLPQAEFIEKSRQVLENKISINTGRFDKDFFNFLFKYRRTIFGFKKRKYSFQKEWVLLKSAYKLASL